MEKDLGKDILEKIKREKIKPRSRWRFMLKDYVVWLVFIASIIFGSLSFSVILHFWGVNDWDAYYRVNKSFLAFVMLTMPYFWLICFLLFLVISYYYFERTRTGYRYEFVKVAVFNLVLSLIFGSLLYGFGIGQRAETELAKRAPFYGEMRERQAYIWIHPENGAIVGRVIEIDEEGNIFQLDAPDRVRWQVDASDANYPRGFVVKEGIMIKVFGKKRSGNSFKADEIRPLMREEGPDVMFLPHFGGK